jgi:sn-glycerol 3-phosphate transport system substrate-binding protein
LKKEGKMKALRFLVVMMVLLSLIVACAPATTVVPPAATTAPVAPAATQPPAPAAKIEMEFWTLLGGDLGVRLQKMIDEYNASQSQVVIKNVNLGDYEPLQQKLLAAIVAGNVPPVTFVDYKNVQFFAQEKIFEPIDNLASAEDMKDFVPSLLVDSTYQGKVYALPFNRSYQGLYYNKDLFAASGLDPEKPPKTWDEFSQYMQKINNTTKGTYGTYIYRRTHEHILGFGGNISDENCNVTVNDANSLKAIQYLQDMRYKWGALVPANMSGAFDQTAIEFIQGKVGMYIGSIAQMERMGRMDFKTGFALLPAGPGGQRWVGGGGNLAISASAKPEIKKAAWDFVKFLTSTKKSAEWHMGTGYLPTRKSVSELPEVQEFYKTHPGWKTANEGANFIVRTPCAMINIPEYVNVLNNSMDEVVLKQADVKTVMDRTTKDLQATIDKQRKDGKLIIIK